MLYVIFQGFDRDKLQNSMSIIGVEFLGLKRNKKCIKVDVVLQIFIGGFKTPMIACQYV
jgi:hypothetical protein